MHEEIAASILKNEILRAKAQAILDQPASATVRLLSLLLPITVVMFFNNAASFQAPEWVKILLGLVTGWSVVNMLEVWAARRRLDAALVLLGLQKRFRE
ncbi:hypothetical protein [Massilia putida]|uniref:hypothetical protein n=1 Tax=Massilia putida TaxID=1141883 RepID=UPI000952EC87|nr:hypothetical protein [Massilia putida]